MKFSREHTYARFDAAQSAIEAGRGYVEEAPLSMIRRFIPFLAFPLITLAVDDKPTGAPDSKGGLQPAERSAAPQIAQASEEAANVLKNIQPPAGMKVDLWAAEPMLANPVALSIDERGRVFVAETHRLGSSVLDIRNYMFLLDEDLGSRSVEDRLAMCRKHFGAQFADFGKEEDFIRLLEDRDHKGYADFTSIYAGGFNKPEDGIAAGVLARHDQVWATLIPNLWSFQGTDDKGVAKAKESLSYGYGIRFGYTGHDMHGLIQGRMGACISASATAPPTSSPRKANTSKTSTVARCFAASPMARISNSCTPACAIRRNWPSMISAIFSPVTTTSITAIPNAWYTLWKAAIAAGAWAISIRR